MYDLDTWKTVEPPVGTVYSYPPRGDEQTSMFGAPARSEVGAQMYNQAINTVMVAKFTQGNEKLDDVIKWAEKELEGTLARLSVFGVRDKSHAGRDRPACAISTRTERGSACMADTVQSWAAGAARHARAGAARAACTASCGGARPSPF